MIRDLITINLNPNDPVRGFFSTLVLTFMQSLLNYLIAFAVGTGAAAVVCLYYGAPLAFSLIGGFVVLGVALALASGSVFD